MRKYFAVAATALVGVSAFAANAEAAVWSTVASASDSSPYFAWASLDKTTAYGTKGLRAQTRATRGWVNMDAYVDCNNRSFSLWESRTVSWRYHSEGLRELNTRKLPVPVYGGSCFVMLDADKNGGTIRMKLQRYA
jgi:hypothetical protein